MSATIDLTGMKFGKLTVIKRAENYISPCGSKSAQWLCKCECGNEKVIKASALRKGATKSCGCIWYEQVACGNKTHGMSESRLYECWRDMLNRCYLKTRYDYERYGGRGIKVCDEWKEHFEPFMKWAMENGYKENLTIDRIDTNGNYCPENCRWVDRKEQAVNRRTTVFVEYNGERHSLKDWALKFGKPRWTWYNKFRKYDYKTVLDMWSKEAMEGVL